MAQSRRHGPLADFRDWLRTNQHYAVKSPEREDRISFVSIDEVTAYLEADDCHKLVDILEDIFGPDEPPDASALLPDYVAVLCILVEIGEGSAIDFLYKQDFHDRLLPVHYNPDQFPRRLPPDADDGTFYRSFYEKQWRFCVPDFTRNMDKTFDENLILPIAEMKLAGEGSSADLFEIRLFGPHNKLPKGIMLENPDGQNRNKFALKVFKTRDAETYFKIEVEAFKRLRRANQEYLIAFYGCYTQLNTYSIILENADKGTLKQYFEHEDPPSEAEDIFKFWKSILNLLKGLDSIHNVPKSSGGNFLSGWHQDINPSNILVVSNGATSPYDFIFKLADLGLSHFTSSRDGRATTDYDNFGTKVYGAPECFRHDSFWDNTDLQVKQHVDVWSLGCVYSECAVWVVNMRKGLRSYRDKRLKATKNISPRLGECFHDGHDVLPIVQQTHRLLQQSMNLRGCDNVTMKVVKVVEEFMLVVAGTRLDAKNLWLRSSQAVSASTTPQTSPVYEDPGIDRQSSDIAREPRKPPQLPPTSVAPPRPQKAASDYPPALNGDRMRPQSEDLIDRPRYFSPDVSLMYRNDGLGIFPAANKKKWTLKSKLPFYNKPKPTLPGGHLLHKTHERDHVFIIDDSASMWQHWSEMCELFGILAYIVKRSDEDGIDMCFAMDPHMHNNSDTSELIKIIEQRKNVLDGQCDINVRLQNLLRKYNQSLQDRHLNRQERGWVPKHIKPISYYIFTDGIWDTSSNPEHIIENTVNIMVELKVPRNQVGIQFISFGKDSSGLEKLSHYDNDLGLKIDIVDHCRSSEGLWKMILGAIDPRFDDLTDDENTPRKKSEE
ncbi:hypothetical protein BJ875DRAFT_434529 [Amylocarpus encephaloides]|uniref:Protein kinase domain-containing protein n=1 Tax=Amylocarpus encephaloides TaxID=45428 RepID=A0A9P8C0J2_9HELO|nr:hypothetical protein BJ875DRAFT_434529 [Amylocarpus encephaloides]